MALNINELIVDRVRQARLHDLSTDALLMRLTHIEDASLQAGATGDELTDAVGATITTIYRAKTATFSGSNSLLSLDLLAQQYGTQKEVASTSNKITVPAYTVLPIASGKITLPHTPVENSVKYAYTVVNGNIADTYEYASTAGAGKFTMTDEGVLTFPSGVADGTKIFVEYDYESENAVRIDNVASNFPQAAKLLIDVLFRDVCNENTKYAGVIVCPKAKLDPSSAEVPVTATGKHPFTYNMNKEYCAEEGEDNLFYIVVAED